MVSVIRRYDMEKPKDIGLMDRNELLEILDYLNERLKENQLQLEITSA